MAASKSDTTGDATKSPQVSQDPSVSAPTNVNSFGQINDVGATVSEAPKPTEEAPKIAEQPEVASSETQASAEEAKEWIKKDKDTVTPVEAKGGGSKKALIGGLITFVVVGILAGGIFYFNSKVSNQTPVQSETSADLSTPLPTTQATTSPEPQVDLTTLSINILNGSGTAGQAGVVQELLEEAGFETIETGNAGSFDFKATQVSLKPGVSETVFDTIKSALEGKYVVEQGDALEEDSDYDVVITVGSSTPEAEEGI